MAPCKLRADTSIDGDVAAVAMQSLPCGTNTVAQICCRREVLRAKQPLLLRLSERLIFARGIVTLCARKARIAFAKQHVRHIPIDAMVDQVLGVRLTRVARIG